MKRELINTIIVDKSNFEYIAKTGHINGTLLTEIERILEQYSEARMKEELIEAFNWLSDKDSPYVPLYDEYNEKGIRFITNEADFTSEQVVNSYLATRPKIKSYGKSINRTL